MIKNYIKIAFRVMLRQKFITGVSLFGISFTIMIFSFSAGMVNLLFGNNPPGVNRDRSLFFEGFTSEKSGKLTYPPQGPDFLNDVKKIDGVERLSMHIQGHISSFSKDKKTGMNVSFTDEEAWNIYRFEFVEGRPFTRKEVIEGQSIAVITEAVKRFYFGSGTAVGKMLPTTPELKVIGVIKDFIAVEDAGMEASTVFIPLSRYHTVSGKPPTLSAVVLVRQKADIPGIKTAAMNLASQKYNPSAGTIRMSLKDIDESVGWKDFLTMISIFIFMMMLVPALNLMGLNINRIAERSSEIGIRKSFGASSSTLVGQFLVENMIVTLLGGILGTLITILFSGLVTQLFFLNDNIKPSGYHLVNWTVILYSVLASLFFGILSGVLPAWRMSRLQTVKALKGGNL